MKRLRAVVLSLLLAAAAPALLAQAGSVYRVRLGLYRVHDARGLVSTIGSGRTIELGKGEYRLSEAADIVNPNAVWREVEGKKRLVLSGLKNFSIVGPEGRALVLGGSGEAPILEIERSTAVNFFNLSFARESGLSPAGTAAAPCIKAGSVKMLQVDRCRFEASSGRAIEVEGCEAVRIGYSEVAGDAGGALSVLSCKDIEVYGSLIQGCGGSPLLYAESCGRLLVNKTRLEGNAGESLIELRLGEPASWGIGFDGCSFVGNRFGHFAGSPVLPSTASCSYAGNSFGPDWNKSSVASRGEKQIDVGLDQVYSGFDRGESVAFHFDYAAGIGFSYPAPWKVQEGADPVRALASDPAGGARIMLVDLGPPPPRESEAWDMPGRVFAGAAAALEQSLQRAAKISLSIWADEPPGGEGETPAAEGRAPGSEYSGMAAAADGKLEARVLFLVSKGSIYALLGMAKDREGARLGPEGDIGKALGSAELVQ